MNEDEKVYFDSVKGFGRALFSGDKIYHDRGNGYIFYCKNIDNVINDLGEVKNPNLTRFDGWYVFKPTHKRITREKMINELTSDLLKVFTNEKYERLSCLDNIESINRITQLFLKFQREKFGYEALEEIKEQEK
jgi:hypothetical protein